MLFLSLCVSVSPVLATSGACSDHGGVNCSAGANYDGSVVCNDGWEDSSVSFSSVSECSMNLSSLCPVPYLFGATDSSICDQYQSICDLNHQTDISVNIRAGVPVSASSGLCPQADACRQQVMNNSSVIQLHDQCVQQAFKTQADIAKANSQKQQNEISIINQQNLDAICQTKNGENSYSANGSCHCSTGYFFDIKSNICRLDNDINSDLYCKEQYDNHSIMTPTDPSSCSCESGYQFSVLKECVPIPTKESEIAVPSQSTIEKQVPKPVKKDPVTISQPIEQPIPIQEPPAPLPKPSFLKRILGKLKFW